MSEHPRPAPKKIRLQVVEALRDQNRRFLDHNSGSRSFIDLHDITADGLFEDIAEFLEEHDLFMKPKNNAHQKIQRYQCLLRYPEEEGYPELDVHVTISPKGEPIKVKVAVHESDTTHKLNHTLLRKGTYDDEYERAKH